MDWFFDTIIDTLHSFTFIPVQHWFETPALEKEKKRKEKEKERNGTGRKAKKKQAWCRWVKRWPGIPASTRDAPIPPRKSSHSLPWKDHHPQKHKHKSTPSPLFFSLSSLSAYHRIHCGSTHPNAPLPDYLRIRLT